MLEIDGLGGMIPSSELEPKNFAKGIRENDFTRHAGYHGPTEISV
jgi:hypothetical protein